MSSLTAPRRDVAAAAASGAGPLARLRAALASVTRQEAGYFLFTALLVAGINATDGFEMMRKTGDAGMILRGVAFPLLVGPFVLAGWVLADRADDSRWPRLTRQALALVVSTTLAVMIVPLLLSLVGLDMKLEFKMDGKEFTIPAWAMYVESWISIAVLGTMTIAVLEFRRRRDRSLSVLDASRAEQAQLSHELLESRLSAMQAQVEPQFLFDSLVDVQATYDRNAQAGAEVMDRLITYLRVALPRLREHGSTVQAEVELLAAYLAVVAARHEGRPAVHFVVPPEAAAARFYPMLLLPLVQRAVRVTQRELGRVPDRIELVAKRHGSELGVLLRIETGGLCVDDPELARVRERLAGLYGGGATLACNETEAGCSEFVLRVPL